MVELGIHLKVNNVFGSSLQQRRVLQEDLETDQAKYKSLM